MKKQDAIKIFEDKKVRTFWDGENEKWYFSVIDVVEVLTDSQNPRKYWSVLKTRLKVEGSQLATNCSQLKMQSVDGKYYKTDVADTEQLFRLIQSIPSPKAEPFKLWLAQVGSDRLDEIENPELATQRTRELYKLKGFPDDWIEKRMRSIAIREELTEEWKNRGVKEQIEYAILTAEISKATFGLTPSEYKKLMSLKSQNLRDHMTDLELIFSMLGEASTTKVTRAKNAKGFMENKDAAQISGRIAGNALKELEKESGEKVITSENYLPEPEKTKAITKGKKK
jgi:hypothetical protein